MVNHRNPKDKEKSIFWAKNILDKKEDYVILNTETSGIGKNDVLLEIAIIDLEGNTILNSRIRPTKRKRASEIATNINGIKISELKDAPTFFELKSSIESLIENRTVIIYHSEFHKNLIEQTCKQDGCPDLKVKTNCAMIPYSRFIGTWSDFHSDYKHQKLPNSSHSALKDCLATLKIIQKMASHKMENLNVPIFKSGDPENLQSQEIKTIKWWEFWK